MGCHGDMKPGDDFPKCNHSNSLSSWSVLEKCNLLFGRKANKKSRESWLKEYGLVNSDDMHPDFRELHLRFGYRPIPSTFQFCLKSVFYPTNEALNFWTHFVALVIIVRRFSTMFDGFHGSIYETIYMPVVIYAFGTCLMLIGSCIAHVLCSASHKVRESCWFCDYASITLSSLGSAIVYNNYVCPYDCIGISIVHIMPLLGIAGVVGQATCCYSRRMTSKWRYVLRSSVFMVLYVGSSVPCAIKYFVIASSGTMTYNQSLLTEDVRCSLDTEPQQNAMYFLLVTTFCALTVFFNVSKIPEKWFPGTFDIVGHSHQWLHVCIALAFYFQTFIVEDVMIKVEDYVRDGSMSLTQLHLTSQNTVGLMLFTGCLCFTSSLLFSINPVPLRKVD